MIYTEQLLTSSDGYGVPATPAQRAICRARDGLPLKELKNHPDVINVFGGREAVEALPSERGIKPAEFWNIASPRTCKTTIAAAAAFADTQTVDQSALGPGEVARVSILSLKLDVADVPFNRLLGLLQKPKLAPLLLGKTTNTLIVKTPSGKPIEAAITAGGNAAGGISARWSAGVIPDECCKMASRDEGAVTNLTDVLSVARERMLPGAQIMPIGSPWSPTGDAYNAVQQYFGKPTDRVVVARLTGPAGNPSHWTKERLAALEKADEAAWRIVALGDFLDPESGLFLPVAIHRSTRDKPLELRHDDGYGRYSAAVDPSEGSAKGNAFSLVIVKKQSASGLVLDPHQYRPPPSAEPAKYRVVLAREWRGLSPSQTWKQIAEACRPYGIRNLVSDQYAASANVDIARMYGLRVRIEKSTQASKLEDFTNLATLLHNDRIELSPEPTLRRDLLSVKKRITQGSASIVLPRDGTGRHCDYASALCAAIKDAGTPRFEYRPIRVYDVPGGINVEYLD